MDDNFISYETYLLLKEIQEIFNLGEMETLGFYCKNKKTQEIHPLPYCHQDNPNIQQWEIKINNEYLIAPTYSQVLDWLRNIYSIHISIVFNVNNFGYHTQIIDIPNKNHFFNNYETYVDFQAIVYTTPQKALNKAITYTINRIKNDTQI